MRILVLDISTSCGWAVLEKIDGIPLAIVGDKVIETPLSILGKGVLDNGGATITGFEGKKYPWDFFQATHNIAKKIKELAQSEVCIGVDAIVIEETNGGGRGSRYTQKALEWLHLWTLQEIQGLCPVYYINTADWRKATNARLTAEEKKNNTKVYQAKRKATVNGKLDRKLFSALKKELGIRGKTNKKHAAIRVANSVFGLNLKAKDDDIADALLVGKAFFDGVRHCDGK